MIIFPYQKSTKGDFFPVVNFISFYKDKFSKTSGLVDSGASISIFKSDIAEQLGINIEKGELKTLGGVGGRIVGYIHKLMISIAGRKFEIPVVFSYEYLVSFNLLGREGFFNKFKIIFEEKNKILKLE